MNRKNAFNELQKNQNKKDLKSQVPFVLILLTFKSDTILKHWWVVFLFKLKIKIKKSSQ